MNKIPDKKVQGKITIPTSVNKVWVRSEPEKLKKKYRCATLDKEFTLVV
jgi:hypothetical protein